MTIEKLAAMSQTEFTEIRKEMREGFGELRAEFNGLRGEFDELRDDLRTEMRAGFRMILEAVKTVEYHELSVRIDALESDVRVIKMKQ